MLSIVHCFRSDSLLRGTCTHWPTVVFVVISSSRASQAVDFSARTTFWSASLTFSSASCSLASLSLSRPPSRRSHWAGSGESKVTQQPLKSSHIIIQSSPAPFQQEVLLCFLTQDKLVFFLQEVWICVNEVQVVLWSYKVATPEFLEEKFAEITHRAVYHAHMSYHSFRVCFRNHWTFPCTEKGKY